jgi:hypothetical protein
MPERLCFQCDLQWVLIPASVAGIESEASSSCVWLSEVTFGQPSKLTTIAAFAFADCKSLQRLHIVASVSTIGKDFVGGSGVREITVARTLPESSFERPLVSE